MASHTLDYNALLGLELKLHSTLGKSFTQEAGSLCLVTSLTHSGA